MASSTLRLIIEKGPRKDETLEFNSRSKVRIGRVVKGNNVPIKDSGISSKHLTIDFNSLSGKWEITDLDSSNGTILNSSQLKPLSPFNISTGNQIKIGEFTAIRVEIEEFNNRRNPRRNHVSNSATDLGENNAEIKDESEINIRRNPRRRAASKGGAYLLENVEIGEEINFRRNPRREAASKRGPDLGKEGFSMVRDVKEESAQKGVEDNGRRRRRGRPKRVSNLEEADAVIDVRMTRSAKKNAEENVMASSVMEKVVESKGLDVDDCKEVENLGVVENKKTRGGRGRKKRMGAECLENVQEERMSCEVLDEKVVDVDSRQNVVNDSINEQFQEVEIPQQDGGVLSVREQRCAEAMDESIQQNDNVEDGVCDGVESGAVLDDVRTGGSESEEIYKQSEANCYDKRKDLEATDTPDLENMTLGEWFDFLEVYLPKQIYSVRDEIIENMRKRAKQFDEFMLQHQKY